MINDDLFDLLIEKVSNRNSKVLFFSDQKQLVPVKQRHYSKVYNLPNKFCLSKIYRQSSESALAPVLEKLREHEILRFDNLYGKQGSLIVTSEMKEFLDKAISEIKIEANPVANKLVPIGEVSELASKLFTPEFSFSFPHKLQGIINLF